MHAALLSLMLMSGACGDVNTWEDADLAFTPLQQPTAISVSYPRMSGPYGCPGCACGRTAVPPAYRCCPEHSQPQASTVPACETGYHPAWYFYPNHRMFLD